MKMRATPPRSWLGVALAILAAVALPSAAEDRDAKRLAFFTTSSVATAARQREALLEGLRGQGLEPGTHLRLIEVVVDSDFGRLPELAAKLIAQDPDLIVTGYAGTTLAAMHVAGSTPVVFAAVSDPVGNGMVKSLAHPGGNVTGVATNYAGLGGKRIELLKDAFPKISRVALLYQEKYASACELEIGEVVLAARQLGLKLDHFPITDGSQLADAFKRMKAQGANALYVPTSPISKYVPAIVLLARKHGLPAIYDHQSYVEEGALMSFGADVTESFRRAARYAARILRGAEPSALPVEVLERVRLVVNLKEMRARNIELPPSIMARADEFIE
jgi:putative ABC transport system substrate-binding protein